MRPKVSDLLDKINRLALLPLSNIEIDLLKQHLRELYDELDSLNRQQTRDKRQETLNESQEPRTKSQELKTEEPKEIIQQETVVVKKEVVIEKKVLPKSSINETIQTSESLNSKLKTSSKEIHQKLSVKPLKELLDLNKRFILVNELFKGNTEAFAKAVEQIDSAENFSSAESLIRSQYLLDETSQAARLFFKLVKQKFGEE